MRRAIELKVALALVADDDRANATALPVACGETTDAAETARTEVESMRRVIGNGGSLGPVDGQREDLIAEKLRER